MRSKKELKEREERIEELAELGRMVKRLKDGWSIEAAAEAEGLKPPKELRYPPNMIPWPTSTFALRKKQEALERKELAERYDLTENQGLKDMEDGIPARLEDKKVQRLERRMRSLRW